MQLSYEFYGLREQPFGVTPNPRYYYPSAAHREVAASLLCGFEHDAGFAALVSDPGMGKTMLLLQFLESFGPSAPTAFVFNTQCTAYDFLRNILDELHIPIADQDLFQMHNELKLFLVNQPRAVLIIIDEAHNLADEVLETVRLLSDFEAPDRKLLHIVLAGQRQLAERLRHPQLIQLQQRITIINKLAPLSPEEIGEYVDHRLATAGHIGRELFSPEALANIVRHSHGVPRSINRICFNALLLGSAFRKRVIDTEIIDEVLADLDLTLSPTVSSPLNSTSDIFTPEPMTSESGVRDDRDSGSVTGNPERKTANPERSTAVGDFNVPFTSTTSMAAVSAHPASPFNSPFRRFSAPIQMGARRTVTASTSLQIPGANAGQTRKSTAMSMTLRALLAIAMLDVILGAVLLFWHFRSKSTSGTLPLPSAPSASESQAAQQRANTAQEGPASTSGPEAQRPIKKASSTSSRSVNPLSADTPMPSGAPEDRVAVIPMKAVSDTSLNRTRLSEAEAYPEIPLALASIPQQGSKLPPAIGNVTVQLPTLSTPDTPLRTQDTPIKTVKPVYPVLAEKSNIQGDVVVGISIAKDGTVERAHIVRGNLILGLAALAAVQQWRYPSRYQEMYSASPASIERQITMKFNLSGR